MPEVYAAAIVVLLLATKTVEVVASWLGLRSFRSRPPDEFSDLVDPEDYARTREYAKARVRLGIAADAVALAAVLAFWGAGGFGWLDGIVRSWFPDPWPGAVRRGLAYVGVLYLAQQLLALPFEIASTFGVEARFGFNRTTPATFVADRLKGLLLAAAIGGPLLAVVLLLLQDAGIGAWLTCWATFAAVSLALQAVVPVWILPLFLRFRPLEEGELRDAITSYADGAGFPLQSIYVVDGSRRSTKSNAFFAGVGRRKRLALFDTLVERHPVREIVGVVAHEVGHHRRGHVPRMTALGILHTGLLLALLVAFTQHEPFFQAFGLEGTPVYAGLVIFGLVYTPFEMLVSLGLNALSRRHEREADRFAAETTGDPEALAAALRKLGTDNRSPLTPHPLEVALHYSHPPLVERVRTLRRQAAAETA